MINEELYPPRRYKAEVIADDSGKWVTNGLLFRSAKEAAAYAQDLAIRWTAVIDWRVRLATREEVASGALNV